GDIGYAGARIRQSVGCAGHLECRQGNPVYLPRPFAGRYGGGVVCTDYQIAPARGIYFPAYDHRIDHLVPEQRWDHRGTFPLDSVFYGDSNWLLGNVRNHRVGAVRYQPPGYRHDHRPELRARRTDSVDLSF